MLVVIFLPGGLMEGFRRIRAFISRGGGGAPEAVTTPAE